MLTIREALQMPVLATSRLIAGEEGLENAINWVHTVDIPDARYEWRRRGVLLLTAGFGLRDSSERQAALVPKLVEEGFAGMVMSTGFYFDEVPEVIRQKAAELGFPVIEAPRDLLFIDVAEAILERITNRQNRLLQQSSDIHKQLTNLVLQGGTLDDVARTLANLLKRSISIETPSFHVLTAAQYGPVDDARRRSVENGRTTPQLADLLLQEGIYAKLLDRMGPIHVPPMPELGMNMERFVAPIIVGHEIHGYIWIIAGDRPLTELDEMALDQAATVAALMLFKEKAVKEAEETLRGDFLEQLLKGQTASATFSEQARRLNYHPERPHQVLLIHGPPQAGGNGRTLMQNVEKWLEDNHAPALLVSRDKFLALILENERNDKGDPITNGKQFAKSLIADLSHPACRLLIGVGRSFTSQRNRVADNQAADIRHSYEEAQEAIQIATAMGYKEGVFPFVELGLLHWLYHVPAELRHRNRYLHMIYTLAEYDEARNTDLVHTLESYLDHGGSLVDTAQALYIHRNTLLHRLERINTLCGLDLRAPQHHLNLHVAVKSYRLHDQKPPTSSKF